MQITKSLVAATVALYTSAVLGESVKLAYTSNGDFHQEEIDAEKLTRLKYPGAICFEDFAFILDQEYLNKRTDLIGSMPNGPWTSCIEIALSS
ncbi:hypothetical protein APSETT445_005722 [Aspergillus pseudonomiae]